jgi:hypothetical protein
VNLRGRLNRLERYSPDRCPGQPTLLLTHARGEPRPEVPPDACCCPRCGVPHVRILRYVVVSPGDPLL